MEAPPRTPATAASAKVVKKPPTNAQSPPSIEASFGGLASDDEAEEVDDEGVQHSAAATASKVSFWWTFLKRQFDLLTNQQIIVKVEHRTDTTGPTPSARKVSREHSSIESLPQHIRALWTTNFIPLLYAYIAHLDTDNPFVVTDLVGKVRDVFRKVYTRVPSSEVVEIGPKSIVYKLVSGRVTIYPQILNPGLRHHKPSGISVRGFILQLPRLSKLFLLMSSRMPIASAISLISTFRNRQHKPIRFATTGKFMTARCVTYFK